MERQNAHQTRANNIYVHVLNDNAHMDDIK